MYVCVVFVIRCLYSTVSLTLVREWRFIRIIIYYYCYYYYTKCGTCFDVLHILSYNCGPPWALTLGVCVHVMYIRGC